MRIFITAGGTVTAQAIFKGLRADSREHFVAVGDMDPLNASRGLVDAFVQLPAAASLGFAEACLAAAREHHIELLIPLIVEREFEPLLPHRDAFDRIGCKLWVPDAAISARLGDKLFFAQFLKEIGIDGPETRLYSKTLDPTFPVVVKPRAGSGSVGTFVAHSLSTLHEFDRPNCVVQDFIEGAEFTVDCFAAAPGRVVAVVARERIQIKAGVATKARIVRNDAIEAAAEKVVALSGLVGPANVQGMLAKDGHFSVFETNPRFGATTILTTAAGINFPSLLVDLASGIPIPDLRGRQNGNLAMARYWEEIYFEGSEIAPKSTFSARPARDTHPVVYR